MYQWYRTYWACVKTLGLSPRTRKEVTDPHCCFNHFCGLEQYLVHYWTKLNTVSIYTELVAHPSLNPRQHTTFQPPLRVLCASGVSPTPYSARPDLHSDLRVSPPCCGWFSHSGPSFMTSILGEAQKQNQYFYLPSLIPCIFKVSTHDPALS